MLTLLARLALPASLLLAACDQDPAGPGGPSGGGQRYGSYTVKDTVLAFVLDPRTLWECDGATLVPRTMPPETTSSAFSLRGDTLRSWDEADTLGTAVVRRYFEVVRIGRGSGIEGRWRERGAGYVIESGSLSPSERDVLDLNGEYVRRRAEHLVFEYEFHAGTAYIRISGSFADHFLADWNGLLEPVPDIEPDSARYDIEVTLMDTRTVRLKGRKTGETVTVTHVPPRYTRKFSSDNPIRRTYDEGTDDERPCPEDRDVYDWFETFKEENARSGLGKRGRQERGAGAEIQQNRAFSAGIEPFPLKSLFSFLN